MNIFVTGCAGFIGYHICKKLLKDISSQLNLTLDETNHDSGITLKEVFCLGNCAIGPSVMINETVIGEATTEKIISHLEEDGA